MENRKNILSASTLINDDVYNTKEEKLGTLEEIMIDVSTGRIAYAVLSFGGFLGMGDKLFSIPWAKITVDQVNERCILNVDKEILEKAEGFDKDHWPDMVDESWAIKLHDYYKTPPYWK